MNVLARAATLQAEGRAFALATVVWRRGPSSAKAGAQAIIHPDGVMEGWLGGACAQPTVVRVALESLTTGEAALLVLGEADDRPGVIPVAMACSSEGAMEVYVEPFLPRPRLWVVGDSPACHTLVGLADVLGWHTRLTQDEAELRQIEPRALVVIATQGHHDETALEVALGSEAAYVGLVASEKRASGIKAWLRERGMGEDQIARIHAPAGLDLGSTEHVEMAVAVLAELVAFKAAGAGAQVSPVTIPEIAVDPVCGMDVDVASARWVSWHQGEPYHFCAPGCKKAFDADPTRFLG